MNLQYMATMYLTIFALVIMMLIVRKNDLLSKERQSTFVMIFSVIIAAALSEWLGNWMDGASTVFIIPHIIAKAADHTLAPVISIGFVALISGKKRAEILKIPLILHGILELASGCFGFIYYVDAQNIYHHGNFYWIYVVFYLSCSVFCVMELWKFGKKYQNTNRLILELVLVFLVSGVAFRLFTSDVKVDYLCLAIDTIIIYIYYTEIIEKNDSITGLLNRRSYEGYISNVRNPIEILFFDVDDFKYVNDTYGHAFGDKSLEIVGRALTEIYAGSGHCYRIGGDEFCVLLNGHMDSVEELNSMFESRMHMERQKDPRLPYVSVGEISFDPSTSDIESAMHEADARMYRNKERNKASRR